MKHPRIQVILAVVAAFNALTAIGGGIAMLAGVDQFPPEWLYTTPFRDYTVPALTLAIVIGGSSLVAAVIVLTRGTLGIFAALAAGLLMVGDPAHLRFTDRLVAALPQPIPRHAKQRCTGLDGDSRGANSLAAKLQLVVQR